MTCWECKDEDKQVHAADVVQTVAVNTLPAPAVAVATAVVMPPPGASGAAPLAPAEVEPAPPPYSSSMGVHYDSVKTSEL